MARDTRQHLAMLTAEAEAKRWARPADVVSTLEIARGNLDAAIGEANDKRRNVAQRVEDLLKEVEAEVRELEEFERDISRAAMVLIESTDRAKDWFGSHEHFVGDPVLAPVLWLGPLEYDPPSGETDQPWLVWKAPPEVRLETAYQVLAGPDLASLRARFGSPTPVPVENRPTGPEAPDEA